MSRIHFGPFTVDSERGSLSRDGVDLEVQPLVIELFAYAAEHAGELMSKEALMAHLWPDVTVTAHSLTQLVYRVRKLLGEHSGWWHTVPRRGFRFDAPVIVEGGAPADGDSFHGRREELAAIAAHWAEGVRWLTLWGPGGAGRTRLADESARREAQVLRLDLSMAAADADLVEFVAAQLGVELASGDGLDRAVEAIGRALHALGEGLALADNLEQLRTDGSIFARWLALAPGLRWLATSREPVGLDGEVMFAVPPLAVADGVQLFTSRAARVGAGGLELELLEAVVTELEGSPLAIELAAARVPLLGLAGVRDRLRNALSLLAGGEGPARHHSMRATVTWSWELLSEAERDTLCACARVAPGFTVGMVEALTERPDTLDHLASLQRQSLVRPDPAASGRLRLAEPVRVFAAEKGAERPDAAEVEARLVASVRARLREAERLLDRWDRELAASLGPELANGRIALGLTADRAARDDLVASIVALITGSLGRSLSALALATEQVGARPWAEVPPRLLAAYAEVAPPGRELDQACLLAAEHAPLDLRLRLWAAVCQRQYFGGELESVSELAERAEALARDRGEPGILASMARFSALASLGAGDLDRCEDAVERGLHHLGELPYPRRRSRLLDLLAFLRAQRGQTAEAIALFERVIALEDAHGLRGEAVKSYANLAVVLQEAGRLEEALRVHGEAIGRARSLGVGLRLASMFVSRGLTHLYLDRLAEADEDLRMALVHDDGKLMRITVLANRAALESARGRWRRAQARAEEGLALTADVPHAPFIAGLGIWLVLAQHALGEDAAAMVRRLDALPAGALPAGLALAWQRVRAEVCGGAPPSADAPMVHLVERAIERLEWR